MGKLTAESIALLKREMNFLLWTDDPPTMSEDVAMFRNLDLPMKPGCVNMQCLSHAYITAGLLKDSELRICEGHAFISDGPNNCLHQVPVHFWIMLGEQGFVDLSLHAEMGAPAVWGERCYPGEWEVAFTQDRDELNALMDEPGRLCAYYGAPRRSRLSLREISSWMDRPFDGAIKQGIVLPLGNILAHCNRFLKGTTGTATGKTQKAAWQFLAR